MDEKTAQSLLIKILSCALNGTAPDETVKEQLTPEILGAIYRLAKKQDLAHLVSRFVSDNGIRVPQELYSKIQREEILSVYRYEQLNYTFEEICGILDKANIAYVPLKGSVIRPFYPDASMRTSCDIDILIHEADIESAVSCFEEKGYRFEQRNYHDVSLYSPANIHLELHFSIQENMENLDAVLNDVWEYATLTKGSRYELRTEFFVFHMFAHMAYHFLSGGCGIRALMDLWVMEHHMNASYSCAEPLLKKAGIDVFAVEMSKLANQCFTEHNRDAFSELLLGYIYRGGVYGSFENSAAIQRSEQNSTLIYVLKRLFLPYKIMVLSYPILKKAPFLLPFYWVIRWIKGLRKGKNKKAVADVKCAGRISDEKIEEAKAIRSQLGL